MAMFQQYQQGIAPVQGISEAGARIGQFAEQGLDAFGKSLGEGIKAYNENSAKSEMANVKIAGLSQDIANKIAMYSQDPEIAQSGVLQGLMQKGQMLTEAPTKGLSQRLAIAHDAETSLAGFGQQLQEWSFLRGRAIERGVTEGLKKFENAITTTDPIFFEDPNFAVDPNQTIQQQKDRVMAYFKKVRAANPRIQGSDEDFWAGWVNTAQQRFAKGIEGLHPSVTSAQLEALQAEQNIAKNQKSVNALSEEAIGGMIMNKDGIYEESTPLSSSVKDYAAMTATPADRPYNDVAEGMKMLGYENKQSYENNQSNNKKRIALQKEIAKLQSEQETSKKTETISDSEFNKLVDKDPSVSRFTKVANLENQGWSKSKDANGNQVWTRTTKDEAISKALDLYKSELSKIPKDVPSLTERLAKEKENITKLESQKAKLTGTQQEAESNNKTLETVTDALGKLLPTETFLNVSVKTFLSDYRVKNPDKPITKELVEKFINISRSSPATSVIGAGGEIFNEGLLQAVKNPFGLNTILKASVEHDRYFTKEEASVINKAVRAEAKLMDNPKGGLIFSDSLERQINNSKEEIAKIQSQIKTETPVRQVAPKVGVGELVVGQQETTRPLTVSERKSQVSDFLTERFGAIDPTDPTGKKRIAVQGFDAFFQKAVPESEIKEFTTESGTRLIHLNGKWEMVKEATPRTMKQVREDMIGVYGKQTADGRLVPTELIPNSGVEIGGLYRGTDASEATFNDEMTQLIDARRGVKRLQEINDKVGEFASLKDSGEAAVEVMNLRAALRKDIIGVGTVSNYEQSLIQEVIIDPTKFLSMESKDRAILLALAQRIDRRIQNIGSSKGLTVRIRDVNSANRYDAMRQQYLKAKGIL
jgi:hypothetical protein